MCGPTQVVVQGHASFALEAWSFAPVRYQLEGVMVSVSVWHGGFEDAQVGRLGIRATYCGITQRLVKQESALSAGSPRIGAVFGQISRGTRLEKP
jgi:hypothetical protein